METAERSHPRQPLATEPGISPLLRSELQLLNTIRTLRRRLRGRRCLFFITGSTFFTDFAQVVWAFTMVYLFSCEFRLFWTFGCNLTMALLLGAIVPSKSPGFYDKKLKTTKRVSPSALPCLELWLMTSVMLHLCFTCQVAWYGIVGAILLFGTLLCSRIFSLAFFMHQLLISVIGGIVGYISVRGTAAMVFKKEPRVQTQLVCALGLFLLLIGYLGYKAERNETAIMGVPKQEYERVLMDIMNNTQTIDNTDSKRKNRQDSLSMLLERSYRNSAAGKFE